MSTETPVRPDEWFWCVAHQRAEQFDGTEGHTYVGPFFTEAEAQAWNVSR